MVKNYKAIVLDPKYTPKKTEKYMSEEQKAYFYQLLNAQRAELLSAIDEYMNDLSESTNIDAMDGANDEGDDSTAIQSSDMLQKMIGRNRNAVGLIDNALDRLENGTYGFSVLSNEEIGLKRLMARPLATLTTAEQEEHEHAEI
ncbi:MAG: TraR/DksA family transcriptional regulator [Rickettsiales bacterium]|jgi:DnaK suppressor protein|nr:TraR/DksA family transcriptional regulator [Rickettsiales bacterium]